MLGASVGQTRTFLPIHLATLRPAFIPAGVNTRAPYLSVCLADWLSGCLSVWLAGWLSVLDIQGKVLAGGAAFACLLMLKHLFLSLAPLYFVHLLRHYCFETRTPTTARPSRTEEAEDTAEPRGNGGPGTGSGRSGGVEDSKGPSSRAPALRALHDRRSSKGGAVEAAHLRGEHAAAADFSLKRLVSLGAVVMGVFVSTLGPLCVSDGWTREACLRQLGQLATRLFPFGRFVLPLGRLLFRFRRLIVFARKDARGTSLSAQKPLHLFVWRPMSSSSEGLRLHLSGKLTLSPLRTSCVSAVGLAIRGGIWGVPHVALPWRFVLLEAARRALSGETVCSGDRGNNAPDQTGFHLACVWC